MHRERLLMRWICFIVVLYISCTVMADQTTAYCKLLHGKQISYQGKCSFSQYQGYIYITLPGIKSLELSPKGTRPGNFTDKEGKAVYRKSGLGKEGQIYQFSNNEMLYVYWNMKQKAVLVK